MLKPKCLEPWYYFLVNSIETGAETTETGTREKTLSSYERADGKKEEEKGRQNDD